MNIRIHKFSPKSLDAELIAGQGTFNLLAIELLFQSIAISTGGRAEYGIAFAEGSDGRMLRKAGNNKKLIDSAAQLVREIHAGHYFAVLMQGVYPIEVVNSIKNLPTTIRLDLATGNDVVWILCDLDEERSAVLGASDGKGAHVFEDGDAAYARRKWVRDSGYAL